MTPTLVRMLHKLECEGLVEPVATPADRRAKSIRLSGAAESWRVWTAHDTKS